VTSDTMTLRNYFRMGTVYTKHDRQSLTAAIAYALAHKDRLAAEMDTLRLELARDWTRQKDALLRILQLGEATPVWRLPCADSRWKLEGANGASSSEAGWRPAAGAVRGCRTTGV